MKNLKKLRERFGYSQKQVAEMLGTTQQTVARWETGKAEPNLAALRDLAVVFHTSVDWLLDRKTVLPHQSVNPLARLDGEDGFWGHVGIRLPTKAKTSWYPVTTSTMNKVFANIQSFDKNNWITFQTLNNKMVIFRASSAQFVTFLDEADDSVCSDDWELSPDAYEGWSEEIYRCLEEYYFDLHGEDEFSSNLIELTKKLAEEHDLDEDRVMGLCSKSRLVFRDGAESFIISDDKDAAGVFMDFDLGENDFISPMIHLNDGFGGRDIFFSLEQIALIEFPLIKLKEGLEKLKSEMEADESEDV